MGHPALMMRIVRSDFWRGGVFNHEIHEKRQREGGELVFCQIFVFGFHCPLLCCETPDALQSCRRFLLDKPVDFPELFCDFFGSETLAIQPTLCNEILAVLLIRNYSHEALTN